MKIVALIVLIAEATFAAEPWQFTDANLHTSSGDIQRMDATGLDYVDDQGRAHRLPVDQLVELRSAASRQITTAGTTLLLSDGQRWVGAVGEMTGERLTWKTALLGAMSIPLTQARGIVRGDGDLNAEPNAREDVVNLANGDAVRGAISGMNTQNVSVQTTNGAATVAWSAISAVKFASLQPSPAIPVSDNWQIALDDGTVVDAATIIWSGGRVDLHVKGKPRAIPAAQVMEIEALHGPVIFLASQKPVENVQEPLLGSAWPAEFDRDLRGNVLPDAISVHAYSHLEWEILPGFTRLHLQYSIPEDLPLADITVRVRLDGRIGYEQAHLHGGTQSLPVDLKLDGAKRVSLEMDTATPYRTQGWLTWIAPALLR